MVNMHKLIASVFGIGYIGKGGGTIAAAAYCLLIIIIPLAKYNEYVQAAAAMVITGVGVWSASEVDAIWGKDSSKVVIDEVAGMMITLLFIPVNVRYILAGLILFRFFDIAKPLFIKKMEALPKGWGVMADDVLAGVYANILLQTIIILKLL